MNCILVTHGTEGDVHPFVGLGITLRAKGHDVTLMTNAHFARHAAEHGFDFVPIGTEEEFFAEMANPDIWKGIPGARSLGRWMARSMPTQYDAIIARHKPGDTIIVASGATLGARIANETHGIPLVTIVLQPAILRSAYAMPVVAGAPQIPGWVPPIINRAILRSLDIFLDRIFIVKEINAFRARFNLSPINRMMHNWWLSPQCIIALFPDWYAPKQPDWPQQLSHAGFPLFDEHCQDQKLEPHIESFLRDADAPIAFTPGSGMMHARDFFSQSVKACELIGRRGVLLTRFEDQVPNQLPESVRHFKYVPFSQLLPRCSAIVHHGGIGTLSQAMVAGIPQLIMPLAWDQPDNANRLKRMGVADAILPKHFRAPAVAKKLSRLLNDQQVSQQCHHYAQLLHQAKPLETTCDLIESMGC